MNLCGSDLDLVSKPHLVFFYGRMVRFSKFKIVFITVQNSFLAWSVVQRHHGATIAATRGRVDVSES
jgi:hypothetical protein